MHVLQNECIQNYLDDAVFFRKPCPWLLTDTDMGDKDTGAVGTGCNSQIVVGIVIGCLIHFDSKLLI